MRFIAIDLELEQPNTNQQTTDSLTDEETIIQVGIVVFELTLDEPNIIHSETIFLHYPHPLSKFIKTLTSITDEQVNSSTNSPFYALQKIALLRKDYGTSRQILEWGSGDVLALREHSGLSLDNFINRYGFARSTINVKNIYQAYALANSIKIQGGLSKSMAKLKLDFKNTSYNGKNKGAHWAETDALNTARIYNKLINLMRKNGKET
jgi:DNA polymerase III alpha subunit (gram-positive type)